MKIQVPIDSSGLTFTDVMPPDRVLYRQTTEQKTDVKGEPYAKECGGVLRGRERAEMVHVKFSQSRGALKQNNMFGGFSGKGGSGSPRFWDRMTRKLAINGRQLFWAALNR
jgi:hypothetical protein